jgi:hypothetical protein
MNDKGKGKASATTSPSSTTAFNVVSSMPAIPESLKVLLGGKGKCKQEEEPLPGKFPSNFLVILT